MVGEIGGAFVDQEGTLEIGYAVVESQRNRGYATAAVEALVRRARKSAQARRVVAHTPLDRPESGRVLASDPQGREPARNALRQTSARQSPSLNDSRSHRELHPDLGT